MDGWVDKRRKKQEEEEPRITKKERKERLFRGFGCCFFSKLLFSLSLFLSHWLFISSVERVDSTQELTTSIIGDGWVGEKKGRKSRDSRGTGIPKTHLFIYLLFLYILLKSHGIVSTRFEETTFLSFSLSLQYHIHKQ